MDLTSVKWRKSTYSGVNSCIEVAFIDDRVAIRSSKDLQGQVLVVSEAEWRAFLGGVRDGQFDP